MSDSLDDAMDKPFIRDTLDRWKQDKRNGSRSKAMTDTTPASDETERLCRALDLRYKRNSIMDNEAFEAKQHMRALQAENEQIKRKLHDTEWSRKVLTSQRDRAEAEVVKFRVKWLEMERERNSLQADNERLKQQVTAQHDAMRTEWKDLIAERDKYKAENEQLIDDINQVINKCAELEADIGRLESDAQISEGVAEYHIGENTRLKRAIREALNDQRNCQDILRKALEHFTDE